MHDRRVAQKRARAAFHRSEAERLDAEADAAEAARAAGVSQWGSELPPLFLLMVLKRLSGMWRPRAFGAIRATCSTWSSIFDAWCPELVLPLRWTAVMADKMAWFPSVTTVDLTSMSLHREEHISSNLVELRSLPSLHTLTLPASCTERAEDAEALYGLSTLTELSFVEKRIDDDGEPMVDEFNWVLDLSRMTVLSALHFDYCATFTDDRMLAMCNHLTGLTKLSINDSFDALSTEGLCAVSRLAALATLTFGSNDNVTWEVLQAVSQLTALTSLNLPNCTNVTTEGLPPVMGLTALTHLDLNGCYNVTTEGLREVSKLTALRSLILTDCDNTTDEVLGTLSCLSSLVELELRFCYNVTAAGKQALRTALPNLTIYS